MYTVFRITSNSSEQLLLETMCDFNVIQTGLFERMKRGMGASASIFEGDCWIDHSNKIKDFIKKFSQLLNKYKNCGLSFEADVAVYKEDTKDRLFTCFQCDLELLKLLSDNNVLIEFSLYPMED